MAKPVWITPAGTLGTVPEGVFFQTALLADIEPVAVVNCTATSSGSNRVTCTSTAKIYPGLQVMFSGPGFGGINPTVEYFVLNVVNSTQFTLAGSEHSETAIPLTTATGSMDASFTQYLYYTLQSGEMPPGIQCGETGLILGVAKAVASFQGVPLPVGRNVTSKFTIRVFSERPVNGVMIIDSIADRTYSLTVTGQDFPNFVTPAGNIGTFYDGVQVNIPIEFTDQDPGDTVFCEIVGGELPPGLVLTPNGVITGYIIPAQSINQPAGFDLTPEYSYPYDFLVQSENKNYQFTIEITDGKQSNLRTFTIYVYSRDSMTADTTDITADNYFVTADETPLRDPLLLNPPGSIGTVRHDNFFAYKFNAVDLDGAIIEYIPDTDQDGSSVTDSSLELPPGTELDPSTGWLYGYIPDLGISERTYRFGVTVRKEQYPRYETGPYYYSLTIIGAVDTEITWLTPSNLGSINNGAVSLFEVKAVNKGGRSLNYQLDSGSTSSLPQGLELLPNGLIIGRVSFNTFALDGGTTTFDKKLETRLEVDETTFDMNFTFTVNATSADGLISVFKTFTIVTVRYYNQPYENLYIKAMPPQSDRVLVNSLLQDKNIIVPELIYRGDDPNFGIAKNIVYWHTYGLTSSTIEAYVQAMDINHYWKTLTLGEIKVAQARDLVTGEVVYEAVYSSVIDDLVNNQGESVSKEVTLPYPINAGDSTEITTVYPNALVDMRQQIINQIGQISNVLPLWMTSKQANGQQLGFTPSWVICYAKPGQGDRIAYYIKEKFGIQLNKVDFDVDRYELDRTLSIHWDPLADSVNATWVPLPSTTTFDDATTIFDGNSLKFISPVDMYTSSDVYNKYLVFPKRNILE